MQILSHPEQDRFAPVEKRVLVGEALSNRVSTYQKAKRGCGNSRKRGKDGRDGEAREGLRSPLESLREKPRTSGGPSNVWVPGPKEALEFKERSMIVT